MSPHELECPAYVDPDATCLCEDLQDRLIEEGSRRNAAALIRAAIRGGLIKPGQDYQEKKAS